MSTKQEHYIPQFYLKRFGNGNRIDVYDLSRELLRENQSIKNFACVNHFYDLNYTELEPYLEELFTIFPNTRGKSIFADNQFIEKYLSRLETEIAEIFRDLEHDPEKIKNENYQSKIIIFLHDLAFRTEKYRKDVECFNQQTFDFLKRFFPVESLSEYTKEAAKRQQLSNLLSLRSLLNVLYMLTENYDWYIGINQSATINFIISDNPAVDIILGFNDICIPISKKVALVFKIKDKTAPVLTHDSSDGIKMYLSEKSVSLYNCKQFLNAGTYAFGDKKSLLFARALIRLALQKKKTTQRK